MVTVSFPGTSPGPSRAYWDIPIPMLSQTRGTWLDSNILIDHWVRFLDHLPVVLELNRIISGSDLLAYGPQFWTDPSGSGHKPKREPSAPSPEELKALIAHFARDIDPADFCKFPGSDLDITQTHSPSIDRLISTISKREPALLRMPNMANMLARSIPSLPYHLLTII